jgi:hypothetical protein
VCKQDEASSWSSDEFKEFRSYLLTMLIENEETRKG